ncbi:hypothetical protein Ancab_000143 [Ancistrocladus abbreviatus]
MSGLYPPEELIYLSLSVAKMIRSMLNLRGQRLFLPVACLTQTPSTGPWFRSDRRLICSGKASNNTL